MFGVEGSKAKVMICCERFSYTVLNFQHYSLIYDLWRKKSGSLCKNDPKHVVHHLFLIHSTNPQSQPVVILIFARVVRPQLSKYRKMKQISLKIMVDTGGVWVCHRVDFTHVLYLLIYDFSSKNVENNINWCKHVWARKNVVDLLSMHMKI